MRTGNFARFFSVIALVYFVLIFSLVEISTMVRKSPTVDEPLHLFAGYSYLKWGDFRANSVHPPLVKIWAALPLLAFNIIDPRISGPHWHALRESSEDWPLVDIARDMFFVRNDGEVLFFAGKLQMVALAIFLGLTVYIWSQKLFGLGPAVVALFIFALDPNIIAHSQIIHTDVPFAAAFFISSYFFWRYLGRASWSNLLLASVFFGLAAITKYTYTVIMPIWLILGLVKVFSTEPQYVGFSTPRIALSRRDKAILLAIVFSAAGAMAYLLIWAAYGFRFSAIPGGQQPLPVNIVLPAQGSLLRPVAEFVTEHQLFPESWIYGQLFVVKYLRRPAFLFGEFSDGFWSYFPVAFAVKTPLPTLVLLGVGVWMLVRGRINRRVGFFLLLPVGIYFFSAVGSRMNIGLRHILPIYPFLFVFAGGAAAELWRSRSRIKRSFFLGLALWYVTSCIWTYPHYLAYFNELAGGAEKGHKILIDSSLDWGQDLKGLKQWMDKGGVENIQFLYFGTVDPEYYGIDASYIPGSWINYDPPATRHAQEPKYIAISVYLLYTPWRETYVKWYRSRQPVAKIGHSIYIFERQNNRNGGT